MKLLITWNVATCILMGLDKWKAMHNRNRISEKQLLSCGGFFGSLGILLGMILFRHKIRKPRFYIIIPLFVIIQILIIKLVDFG